MERWRLKLRHLYFCLTKDKMKQMMRHVVSANTAGNKVFQVTTPKRNRYSPGQTRGKNGSLLYRKWTDFKLQDIFIPSSVANVMKIQSAVLKQHTWKKGHLTSFFYFRYPTQDCQLNRYAFHLRMSLLVEYGATTDLPKFGKSQ